MPRQIHLLNQKPVMRSGIAMIMAIAFLVIVSGMLAVMLNLSSVTSKKTEQLYFKEQAQLLARSASEYALLAISGHNRAAGGCVQTINSVYPNVAPIFNITTNIQYIGLTGNPAGCNFVPTPFPSGNPIAPESEGMALIDVYVTSIEANLNIGETISYHRRVLQKP